MKEYKSSSRLLNNYSPMSTTKRSELIKQLDIDMAAHPVSSRRFKEEKCRDLGVDLRTYDRWIAGEGIGHKSLSRIEIGLSKNYKACSLMYVEDPKDMSNFLSKMTHYIVEASWLNDLDEAGKLKIKDSLDRLAILIKNMHARSKTKELMDVITEITEEKSSVKKFIDDAKKDGVTFFCSYIPTFMNPKDVEDDEDIEEEDIVGLICINIIPIENLKSRATVQPSDLIIEPRWVGIKKVTS